MPAHPTHNCNIVPRHFAVFKGRYRLDPAKWRISAMRLIFVVDTSFSMNQRTERGLSLLDLAKCACEQFARVRGRTSAQSRPDTYVLATYRNNVPTIEVCFHSATSS